MKKILTGFFIITIANTAIAANVLDGATAIACAEKDSLKESMVYLAKDDLEGIYQLILMGECVFIEGGTQVSVIDRGFSTVKIRYAGRKLYTASGIIK